MFTGIVEGMGKIVSISKGKSGAETAMKVDLWRQARGLKKGHSVCINGACLTVAKLSKGNAEFEIVAETVRRTNLGSLHPGDKVNIERSMKIGDRFEGHILLGHVDGTGVIEEIEKLQSETMIWIRLDKGLAKSVVTKGSIAIDGVSLTVVDVHDDRISIALIPQTLKVTTLGLRRTGERVNIEIDILAKYVANTLQRF